MQFKCYNWIQWDASLDIPKIEWRKWQSVFPFNLILSLYLKGQKDNLQSGKNLSTCRKTCYNLNLYIKYVGW
jgi:hypothetical protein